MTINTTESDDAKVVTITVEGRFDFSCHQSFMQAYQAYPQGEKEFIVDLAEAEYMDSSALGMLLQLREHSAKESGRVGLINANDSVRKVLEIANFDKLFDVA